MPLVLRARAAAPSGLRRWPCRPGPRRLPPQQLGGVVTAAHTADADDGGSWECPAALVHRSYGDAYAAPAPTAPRPLHRGAADPVAGSTARPISVFTSVRALAPLSSAAPAMATRSVTLGLNFAHTGKPVAFSASIRGPSAAAAPSAECENIRWRSSMFGQLMLASTATTVERCSAGHRPEPPPASGQLLRTRRHCDPIRSRRSSPSPWRAPAGRRGPRRRSPGSGARRCSASRQRPATGGALGCRPMARPTATSRRQRPEPKGRSRPPARRHGRRSPRRS